MNATTCLRPMLCVCVTLWGCTTNLVLGDDAILVCASSDECPADLICLDEGRCASRESPCVTNDGNAVADGTLCADGRSCVAGVCVVASCGDGVVQADQGEACDPGSEVLCHDDCTLPFCGDGIVDVGESCDGVGEDCQGCFLRCSAGFSGDCNGDPSDGCECTPSIFPRTPGSSAFPTGGVIVDGLFYGIFTADGDELFFTLERFDLNNGIAEGAQGTVLASGQFVSVTQSRDDGAVFATTMPVNGAAARLEQIVDGELTPVDVAIGLRAFAVGADASSVYVDTGTNILVVDRATRATRTLARPFLCVARLEVCGGELVCRSFEGLAAVNLASEETRILVAEDPANQGIGAGCSNDTIVWSTGTSIVQDDAEGPRVIVTLLRPAELVNTPVIDFNGDLVFMTDRIVRLSRATNAIGELGGTGILLAAAEGFVVGSGGLTSQDVVFYEVTEDD